MRRVGLFIIFVLLAACEPYGWDHPFDRMRSQVLSPGYPYTGDRRDFFADGDTVVLMSGVRVPDGYDWQKDTAIGIGHAEIVLYRNLEEVLSFPTGYAECASTDPDSHHLIGGHLYTEFSTTDLTVVKRDGEKLISYEGREYLVGLIERYDGIYTLGHSRSGDGFSFRRNGQVILERPSGTVFGSFQESTYPETGALYEDGGKLYFSYMAESAGVSSAHLVEDGIDNPLLPGVFDRYDDVKVSGGGLFYVGTFRSGGAWYHSPTAEGYLRNDFVWSDCRIVDAGGSVFLAGDARSSDGKNDYFLVLAAETGNYSGYPPGRYEVTAVGKNRVTIDSLDFPGYYFFSKGCNAYFDGGRYVVLTPQDESPPLLRMPGKDVKIRLNGYLTGVEVYVNQSS